MTKIAISFKAMAVEDIPLWKEWAEKPHVKSVWFIEGYETTDYIYQKIKGNGYDYPFIILADEKPIGYIVACDLYAYRTLCEKKKGLFTHEELGTFCMDLFIAEEEYLYKGYGTEIVKLFAQKIFDEFKAKIIYIDPAVANKSAIRCYEKAGFKFVRIAHDGVTDCYVMKQENIEKPTERFTKTVDAYAKYRPDYPIEVLQIMIKDCNFNANSIVADIGSGTGILSEMFLKNGNTVYAVEPNAAMRSAAEENLSHYKNFNSVQGAAEATTLPDKSVDFITVGTAFHWFDAEKAKIEFKRILKPQGWVMITWNVRDKEPPLMKEYEGLITTYATDYFKTAASHFNIEQMEDFFSPNPMHTKIFRNIQILDWEGLQGRLVSTSYCPTKDNTQYSEMMSKLKAIFNHYQINGYVEFLYLTKMYYGKLINPVNS